MREVGRESAKRSLANAWKLLAGAYMMFFLCSSSGVAIATEDLETHFKEEAPRNWDEMMAMAKKYQGAETSTTWDVARGGERRLIDKTRFEWKQNDGRGYAFELKDVIEPADHKDVSPHYVIASNSRYVFMLRRNTALDNWYLTDLAIDPPSKQNAFSGASRIQDIWIGNCVGLLLEQQRLPDIVRKTDFTIQKVSAPDPQQKQLIRVEFNYPLGDRFHTYFSGWILFDALHHWLMREYQLRIHGVPNHDGLERTTTRKLTYEFDRHGFPISVKTFEHWKLFDIQSKNVKREQEEEMEIHTVEGKDLPEEEFTLSAFGLPEPHGIQVDGSSSRLYLWISLVGVFVLAFGVFFIRRSRRFQRA